MSNVIKATFGKQKTAPAPEESGMPDAFLARMGAREEFAAWYFDWEPLVTRIQAEDEADPLLDDIEYTREGLARFTALFAPFHLARMPRTWAELNGVANYCEFLYSAAGGFSTQSTQVKPYQQFFCVMDLCGFLPGLRGFERFSRCGYVRLAISANRSRSSLPTLRLIFPPSRRMGSSGLSAVWA